MILRILGLPNTYAVASESQEGVGYLVRLSPFPACTCMGYRYRADCKHIAWVKEVIARAVEVPEPGRTPGGD